MSLGFEYTYRFGLAQWSYHSFALSQINSLRPSDAYMFR